VREPTIDELVTLAEAPGVVAIGETGLDYFRIKGDAEWQRNVFGPTFERPDGVGSL
jgi:TatD DNase family protein